MQNIHIDDHHLNCIRAKFNVIDIIEFKEFDQNWQHLIDKASGYTSRPFGFNDKVIVVHLDTDYYLDMVYGVSLHNFFAVWQDTLGLPTHGLLFYTNHFGLRKEISTICGQCDIDDQPLIVETFINPLSWQSENFLAEPAVQIEDIEYHGISLMGHNRSHRFALYNHTQKLSHKIIRTIKGAI